MLQQAIWLVENFVYGYDISSDQYSVYGDTIVSLPNARNQHLHRISRSISLGLSKFKLDLYAWNFLFSWYLIQKFGIAKLNTGVK